MHRFPGAAIARKDSNLDTEAPSRNGFTALPSSEEAASDMEVNQQREYAGAGLRIAYDADLIKSST